MNVRTLVRRAARENADLVAVIDGDDEYTFATMWDRGCRVANGLLQMGLKAGDRVAVLEANSVASVDIILGCAAANLVRVPLYARNSVATHLHILEKTGCAAVVADAAYAGATAGWVEKIPSLVGVSVRNDYERWLAAQDATDPNVPVSPDDIHLIRPTGGTTGLPQAVTHSHRTWLAGQRDWFFGFPPPEIGDRCLHVAPISHGSGYMFLPIWWSGGTAVVLPSFDPSETIRALIDKEIAYIFMVPTILASVVSCDEIVGKQFPKLKTIHVSGAPINGRTAQASREIFGDAMHQGYGQTECSPVTRMSSREWFGDEQQKSRLGSVGRPLPVAEVEIRDESGVRLEDGEVGEIVMRRDSMMLRYWNDDEATRAKIIDGWVCSGDIGRFDADGYLWVVDRKGDMIISGGFNIYPKEIEATLNEHPEVKDSVVFAAPSARWGETPVGICHVGDDARVTGDELIQLVSERLGSYKKPSEVLLRTEPFPQTAVGKIDRRALREPYWKDQQSRVAGN
jgi:acyl-CoA synthetase (AMP-forming)/AMP-acid ligase II